MLAKLPFKEKVGNFKRNFSEISIGRLIILGNSQTNISNAQINMNTDNYAQFQVKGYLGIGNRFVNHEVASLKIASNNIDGTGKVINYGSMVSTMVPEIITTKIEIVNFGLVDMTTNKWDQSGYPYTQYYGETYFSHFVTGNVIHNGGGFYSNGSLTTTTGYSFNEGTIFPGGRYFGVIKILLNIRKEHVW